MTFKRVYCELHTCKYSSKRSLNLEHERAYCLLYQGKWGEQELVINHQGECICCASYLDDLVDDIDESELASPC